MSLVNASREEKSFLQKVGTNARRLRNEKGWSLEQTEDHGWDTSGWQYLQKIESGRKNVTLLTLRKLAKLYKVPVATLLEGA